MKKCGMHLNGNSDYEEYRGKKFKCYECEMELVCKDKVNEFSKNK